MILFWNRISVTVGDILCGWSLSLPRDVALVLLSTGAAFLLVAIRKLTSRQATLRQLGEDQHQLRRLIRTARRDHDRDALARYQDTRTRLLRLRARHELGPAVLSLLMAALILTWGSHRLHYLPPGDRETTAFTVVTPASRIGQVVYVLPDKTVDVDGGWMRQITELTTGPRSRGQATWHLRLEGGPDPLQLTVRFPDATIFHQVLVGHPRYLPPLQAHGTQFESRVQLAIYHPFGVPFDIPGLAPWSVAFCGLLLVALLILKRAFGVA